MRHVLAAVAVLALAWAGCSNDTLGTECGSKGDCDDGQECVPLAICTDDTMCQRSCEQTCASDMNCGEGGVCELRAGVYICQ